MTGVLLVTGGGRGIGAATARQAAAAGYAVAINFASDADAAKGIVEDITSTGGRAIAIQGDVADADQVARLFETVDAELGRLTALVNNAGITGSFSRIDAADPAAIARVVDINVNGSLYCAREAVRRMSTRHGGQGGAIVNLSSAAATLGSPGEYVWYAASKGAVDTMTLGLARELADDGIRVNAVAPGLIETEIHANAGAPDRIERLAPSVPMGRAGSADEVADAILFLLSDAASYITGDVVRVSGGR